MPPTQTAPTQETTVSHPPAVHAKAVELGKHILRMTTAAGSGHPSSALALCHIVVELMYHRMRFDPADPWNPAADRLVLSIGHAVPVIYAAYADLGGTVGEDRDSAHKLTLDELTTLRQLDSVLDGHPNPAEGFPFFDAATGSLGQGLSVAAGLALAARLDAIDKRIYVIGGDGESREGQVWEAMDFIVDHKLSNVCMIFSCNGHGQADAVSTQQSADTLAAKATAFGWHVIPINGHDPVALTAAFDRAEASSQPTAVVATTIKGWGVASMQDKNFHGKPIPVAQLDAALAELDATADRLAPGAPSFSPEKGGGRTPDAMAAKQGGMGKHQLARASGAMAKRSAAMPGAPSFSPEKGGGRTDTPITAPPFDQALNRVNLNDALAKKKLATRQAYGAALVALGDTDPRIVALDGDVGNSTFANLFAAAHPDRFFECKIAEQNMITAAAGLAAAGKIPFASSFAKFILRAADQIDMAGISRANIKIVGSHAGVSLGADGPSQMSLTDVAYFRSMTRADNGRGQPVCRLFHPCDAVSAYRCVELMANLDGMCYLRTHRPAAPFLYAFDERFEPGGCKQLREGDRLTIVSSGYILHTALTAAERLSRQGLGCNVFDAYTLPLDAAPILDAAANAGGAILTVEDNYLGGLHAELAEAAARDGRVRVRGLSCCRIPKSAMTAAEVFGYVGVDLERIVTAGAELAGR